LRFGSRKSAAATIRPATTTPARYEYRLRCQLEGAAKLRRLTIRNDLQMAPLALPEMAVGENTFTYSDESAEGRKVRITHRWVERSAFRRPQPPAAAVYPRDGGESTGTDIVFRWTTVPDPDRSAIADYQFELSGRGDMMFPLSMSFYKLISQTADAVHAVDPSGRQGKVTVEPQYSLPQPGLLTPDRRYFWHVRAQSGNGVWGPWSKTWSFTPRGPAYPLEVALDFDEATSIGTLRWKANPVGRSPVKYRVYGSDEKGFTIANDRYQGIGGLTQEMSGWRPANFIAETAATELAVLGSGVALSAANKTYYRVVAVNDRGKRSGPSDYATGRRPMIYS
jgi:hypothetical protein